MDSLSVNALFLVGLAKEEPKLSDGCPYSIMHPYDMSEHCMSRNYIHYLSDLKKRCN
jgi:hypothetical protein